MWMMMMNVHGENLRPAIYRASTVLGIAVMNMADGDYSLDFLRKLDEPLDSEELDQKLSTY